MSPSRLRAWLAAAVTTALTMTMLTTGSAMTAQADDDPPACSLDAGAHISGDEGSSCMSVAVNLASLPAVGETTTIGFDITAEFDRADVRIDADLPVGLEWAQPPAGMEVRVVPSAAPVDQGRLNRASGVFSFTAGETKRFEGRMVATAVGPADIAVRVFAPADEELDFPTDHVYLTVAERGGTSSPGFAIGPDGTKVPGPPGAVPTAPHLEHKPARVHAAAASVVEPLAGTACVTGGWGYVDNLGVTRPAPNYTVRVGQGLRRSQRRRQRPARYRADRRKRRLQRVLQQ